MKSIPKIALTGGPCAGKSSALAYLYKRLESYGMRPIMVPETATLTILAGIYPGIVPHFDFQRGIAELQIYLEDYFERYALNLPPETRPVLICDRGRCDGRAFCTEAIWKKVLKSLNTNMVEMRDVPYKAVIHMITAAEGAEEFYTLDNNLARKETPAQARRSDLKLRKAWLGHPHHRIVANNGDFSHKISEVGKHVLEALGLPQPIEAERKFLLPPGAEKRLLSDKTTQVARVKIEQTYLLSPDGEERRVRKRSQGSFSAFFSCRKTPLSHGKRIEQEQIISPIEYQALIQQRDPNHDTVIKTRFCYFHKNQYQELDVYQTPQKGKVTLEVETEGRVHLPTYFKDAQEVTGVEEHSNKSMSRKSG